MYSMLKYKYKNLLYIFIISFLFFSFKWIISFYYFPEEDISIKIINDSHKDSYMYFHYIKSIANFNFQNIYNTISNEEGLMTVPYGAVIIHTIFYKIFGISSFIFLELLSIFIFLIIFYLIFRKIEFDFITAIFLSLLVFLSPLIISYFNYFEIVEFNTFTNHFYNLRFPRPLVANLFLFYFIYLLIVFNSEKSINLEILIKIAVVAALSLSSFYFFFIIEVIAFLIVFLNKIQINKSLISKKLLLILLKASFIFILFIIPFLYLLINGSDSYSERIGVIQIDLEDKKLLLNNYLNKLLRLKILCIYIFFGINFILIRKFYTKDFEIVKIFYVLFISSILAPIVFIILSSKIAYLYHFNNIIVVCTVLLFMIILFILLKHNTKLKTLYKKISIIVLMPLMLIIHNIHIYLSFDKSQNGNKIEFDRIFKILDEKKIDIDNLVLLTFDTKIMTWALLNNVKDINVVDGTFSPRTNVLTDMSIIESFKFLKLDVTEFSEFIKNKRKGYRFINEDARSIYWQRYQANSLTTYQKSNDFDREVIEHIMTSSPFYAHQFAIPNFEIKRLVNLFLDYKDQNFKLPNLIIINKKHDILKNVKIDIREYCTIHNQKFIIAYLKKNLC